MKPTGARLVMMWLHDNYYLSNDENLISHETDVGRFTDDNARSINYSTVFANLRDLPLSQYDTYKDFLDYEQQPDHLPLFANPGTHLNPRGNASSANTWASSWSIPAS